MYKNISFSLSFSNSSLGQYWHDAPVGDLREVSFLFGAGVRNYHHFFQVGQTYTEERKRKLHSYFCQLYTISIFYSMASEK